jgi:hypothetical protein
MLALLLGTLSLPQATLDGLAPSNGQRLSPFAEHGFLAPASGQRREAYGIAQSQLDRALAKMGMLKGSLDRSAESVLITSLSSGTTSSPSVKVVQTILQQNSYSPLAEERRSTST